MANGVAITAFNPVQKAGLSKKLVIFISIAILLAIGGTTAGMRAHQSEQRRQAANAANHPKETITDAKTELSGENTEPEPAATQKQTTVAYTPKPTTTAPAPAATPAPVVNTTNCLPPNPSIYATYYIGMTNSAYLQTNSYSPTTKVYAALQFAGLLTAVDAKQTVFFAPNDYMFDNLTTAQKAWMNQSPENMRSVLGWHIVTSCITWDGVNPIKDKPNTTLMTLNTLNGPVTFTFNNHGELDGVPVAIWDWFTSNGSVTFITDFIKPPQVP